MKRRKDLILSEKKPLPPEAVRALAEAEDRRKKVQIEVLPKELGGRDGPEPVRYGDWERKGIAIDFWRSGKLDALFARKSLG